MSPEQLIAQSFLVLIAFTAPGLAPADTQSALARDLKETHPEAVGISSERLKRLDEAMQRWVDSKEFTGIVTLAARHGKVVHSSAYGVADLASGKPMREDAIFRIYSMTKPITGVAMMMLYEEGRWHPDDPIAKFIPQFADLKVFAGLDPDGQPILEAPAHAPTMGELMTHAAGFTYGVFGDTWVDLQMLLNGGELDGVRILAPRTVELMRSNHLPDRFKNAEFGGVARLIRPGVGFGYDFGVQMDPFQVGALSGTGTFYWGALRVHGSGSIGSSTWYSSA